ncbi:DUF4365 domain-containing protein [Roseateles sp.]|uniref:DUF4365 domain-containing protein n=1 Tax=Roseateles sp. TaxID=1971397 RepID=UPI003BA74CFB
MSSTKKRTHQHLIDQDGQFLFREKLPKPWVVREYRPDYGLDYSVEVFKTTEAGPSGRSTHETLGEHFFVQLKSIEDPDIRPLTIYGRGNVEKGSERLKRDDPVATVDTYRFPLEVSLLATVERMGIGIPVLLVIADLKNQRCCFVCLNDYVDKVLVPRHEDYTDAGHRTVHVLASNEIGSAKGLVALRWYAKRAKLLAAFQRFTYQYSELQWAEDADWKELAQYFGKRIASYDFWDDTEMCEPIRYNGAGLKRFLQDGRPHYFKPNQEAFAKLSLEQQEYMLKADVFELWRLLALLPKTYEDVWREWFLPTALGHVASEL